MKLIKFLKNNKTALLVMICCIALGEVSLHGFKNNNDDGIQNRITDFVMAQYRRLDEGIYGKLSRSVIEGTWEKEIQGYELAGIVDPDNFISLLEDDLGKDGWRIRFVTLNVIGYYTMQRQEFSTYFNRENSILDYIDSSHEVDSVHIVELSGHVTGKCSIMNWVREIPVIRINNEYKMIIRGMPEVYYLLHNEQWFKALDF